MAVTAPAYSKQDNDEDNRGDDYSELWGIGTTNFRHGKVDVDFSLRHFLPFCRRQQLLLLHLSIRTLASSGSTWRRLFCRCLYLRVTPKAMPKIALWCAVWIIARYRKLDSQCPTQPWHPQLVLYSLFEPYLDYASHSVLGW